MHKADAYLDYLSDFGLRDYETYVGFGGAHRMRAATSPMVEIVLLALLAVDYRRYRIRPGEGPLLPL